MSNRYDLVTETTGIELTREAASMMSTRYELAAAEAAGQRVLEIGCGAALGFGLMGASARQLVGGDYSVELLAGARAHYGARFPFVRLSADGLPFRDAAFDLIVCFEMSYYLPNADAAFAEMHRALAPGGKLLFANANPERPDFIRSPYSTHYHSADEFRSSLSRLGFRVTIEAAYPVEDGRNAFVAGAMVLARRTLEALRLVPRTIEGRARLKRLVFRNLRALPPELPAGFGTLAHRTPTAPGPIRDFKVIYVSAAKPA